MQWQGVPEGDGPPMNGGVLAQLPGSGGAGGEPVLPVTHEVTTSAWSSADAMLGAARTTMAGTGKFVYV